MHHFTDRFAPRAAAVTRLLLACLLSALLPLQAIASPGADDIVVVTVKGEVKVSSGGGTQDARAGSTLELPASLRTGRDGSTDLRQGDTTIGVGPETQLDFPAPATTAGALERVLQPSGNAFYNVGPQGNRRLRVETPLLVAVIKGTQFNVAVAPDSSTISLFEGRLQVLATEDGIAAVELNAGEIAVRRVGEKTIQVLKLRNGGAAPAAPAGSGGDDGSDGNDGNEGSAGLAPSDPGDQASGLPDNALPPDDGVDDAFGQGIPGLPTSPTDGGIAIDVDGGTDGLAGLPIGVDAGLGTDIDLGAGEIGANLNTGVDLGAASVDLGVDTGIDLGAGTIDAGIDAGVDLGAASVDLGVDAGVDLGAGTIDAGIDAGVDLGAASVDAAVDAGVDLGAGTIDAGIDAGVDLGAASVDTTVDTGVDLGAGTVDVGADAGVDLGAGVAADVGADAAVDAGAGTIDAGVEADVAGAEVGVDVGVALSGSDAGINVDIGLLGTEIDLGLGGGSQGNDAPDAPDAGNSGGLLGGILRRVRP